MNKHSIIKTALGTGLLAASLAASAAAIHSFTTPMMYYKLDGAKVTYVAFVPSGPYSGFQGSSGVIMLELYNSGTVSTWNYAMGGAANIAAAAGQGWTAGADIDGISAHGFPVTSDSAGAGPTFSWSDSYFSLGDTAAIELSFLQTPVISSQACNVSFTASINDEDYLQFNNFSIQPSNWPTASASVSYKSKSGTNTADTAAYASNLWNGSNFSATQPFSTFGAFSVPGAAQGSGATYAASSITKANLCTNAYTVKNALNSSGTTIGGKAGMMRLW
jgi:hypothetical protein